MNEKGKPIRQTADERYPEPGLSADNAWTAMEGMLNQQLPSPPAGSKWFKIIKLLAMTAVTCGALVYLWQNYSDNTAGNMTRNKIKAKSTSSTLVREKVDSPQNHDLPTPLSKETGKTFPQKTIDTDSFLGEKARVDSSVSVQTVQQNRISFDKGPTARRRTSARSSHKNESLDRTATEEVLSQNVSTALAGETSLQTAVVQTGQNNPGLLNIRQLPGTSPLAYKLSRISMITKFPVSAARKEALVRSLLKDVHAGLLWTVSVPFSEYDVYFKGTSGRNDFFKTLVPGIWVSKTLNHRNEIVLKARAYSPYFGSKKAFSVVDSSSRYFLSAHDSIPARDSVVSYRHSVFLAKSTGVNLGLQFNRRVGQRLSIGIGGSFQWQRNAFVRFSSVVSDSNAVISSTSSLSSLAARSDTPNYLNTFLVTSNAELLYSWKMLQIGAGLTMPITSMTAAPYKNLRPLNGQITVRWWIR